MTPTIHHRHEDLDIEECWRLLRSTTMGRIAFVHDVVRVLPVSYVVRDEAIYFRTSPYSTIAGLRRDGAASFQIDAFADVLQTDWSVLACGHAQPVVDNDLLRDLWGPGRPEPWADGIRSLFIGFRPEQLTGRRVHPS